MTELSEKERLYVEASLPPSRHADLWKLFTDAQYMPERLDQLDKPTLDVVDEATQRLCFPDAWLAAEHTRQLSLKFSIEIYRWAEEKRVAGLPDLQHIIRYRNGCSLEVVGLPPVPLSRHLNGLTPKLCNSILLSVDEVLQKLHDQGWNHGNLTSESVHTSSYRLDEDVVLTALWKVWSVGSQLVLDYARPSTNATVFPPAESIFGADDEHSFWLLALELYHGQPITRHQLTFGDVAALATDVAARTRLNPVTALLAKRFALEHDEVHPRPVIHELRKLLHDNL